MKRFQFPLAHVLDLRRRQLGLEEAALQALLSERRALETEAAQLEAESSQERRQVSLAGAVEGGVLAALGRYLAHAARRRDQLTRGLADCQARVQARQQKVVEAGRRVKLLEHLEQSRRAGWQRAFDREMEISAQELHLARWKRPARGKH